MLISQLKAHIFELEQHEKDYDTLSQTFRKLQNACSLLNEPKIRLEYELRQKDENYNKQICDLRNENENLQLSYNEKISVNKKLFAENDSLAKQIEMKNDEIRDMSDRINELMAQLDKCTEDKSGLERVIQGLTDIKSRLYSLSSLSCIISRCKSPKKPHLKPKPRAEDVSGSYSKLASFKCSFAILSLKLS